MAVRLGMPLALFLLGLACKPPIEINAAPTLADLSPAPGSTVNEAAAVSFSFEVRDADADRLTVRVDHTELGTLYAQEAVSTPSLVEFEQALTAGAHEVSIFLDDGRRDGQVILPVTFMVNGAPSAPVVSISPQDPTPGDDLVATLAQEPQDPEGTPLGLFWSWTRDGEPFSTGRVMPAIVPSSATGLAEVWRIEVEIFEATSDGVRLDGGISLQSAAEVTLAGQAPLPPDTVLVRPSRPHPAQALQCQASGASDPDGDAVSYLYGWAREESGSFVLQPGYTAATLPAVATSAGESWRCVAASTDGRQSSEQVTADVFVRADLEPVTQADRILDGAPGDGLGFTSAVWARSSVALWATTVPGLAQSLGGSGAIQLFETSGIASVLVEPPGRTALSAGAATGLGTLLGTVDDLDGDGRPELWSTSEDGGGAVFITPASALDGTPMPSQLDITVSSARLRVSEGRQFGRWVATGDISASEPRPEVAITDARGPDSPNAVWIYQSNQIAFGTDNAAGLMAQARITSDHSDDDFGARVALGGDFTGDGVGDVVIGAVRDVQLNERRAVAIFSGAAIVPGADLSEDQAMVSIGHNVGARAGEAVGFYPDMDGDGSDEVWLSAPGFALGRGRVAVFFGGYSVQTSLEFFETDQDLTIEGLDEGEDFGAEVTVVGDLDQDGLPELVVSAPGAAGGAGKVYVFLGATLQDAVDQSLASGSSPARLDTSDAAWVVAGPLPGVTLRQLGAAGDLDGDGIPDLVLGAPAASAGGGQLYAWLSGQ